MIKNTLTALALTAMTCGAAADDISNYSWPITQRYEHNPLFVGFPAQKFQSTDVGHMYTADPSAHVWTIDGEERLYVYASHDQEPAQGCGRMDRYHVFSTTDMVEWTDHGEILNSTQVPWAGPSMGFMWAPDAAYRDGKYYFYYPHPSDDDNWNTTWKVGVAVSTEPASGFQDIGYIPDLGDARAMIDPCVFVDDDGLAYFYYGGGGWLVGGRLKDNMKEIDGQLIEFCSNQNKALGDFHEAAWVFKRGGTYYLTYSDNHTTDLGGNNLCYATAQSPLGPWTVQGVYMLPHGFDTAHGSVVEYKGRWYQFYHTGNYSNKGNLRSVCFDELTFDDEGRINIVRTWGQPKGGVLPEASLNKTLRIEAEDYNEGPSHTAYYKRPKSSPFVLGEPGTASVVCGSAADNVTYLEDMTEAEWVRYSFTVKEAGRYNIVFRMRQTSASKAQFRLGIDGYWLRSSAISVSSMMGRWGNTELKNIELQAGEHFMEIRMTANTADIDYIEIGKSVQRVPGVIEAEDYDDEGYYFQKTDKLGGNTYRQDQGVSLGTRDGYIYIGDTSRGDWFNYTFVAEPGVYTVRSYVSSMANGRFFVDFDGGQQRSEETAAPTGGWQAFQPFDHTDVELSAGEHTMTFHVLTDLNIDRFAFIKTADLPLGILAPSGCSSSGVRRAWNLQGQPLAAHGKGIRINMNRKTIIQ